MMWPRFYHAFERIEEVRHLLHCPPGTQRKKPGMRETLSRAGAADVERFHECGKVLLQGGPQSCPPLLRRLLLYGGASSYQPILVKDFPILYIVTLDEPRIAWIRLKVRHVVANILVSIKEIHLAISPVDSRV